MKIDFSTIFLVLPGLFSLRSQNSIVPRSVSDVGATEELADFVVQGLAVHLLIALFCGFWMGLIGLIRWNSLGIYFKLFDHFHPELWADSHVTEAILLFAIYVFATFLVGHLFGLFVGVWRLRKPVYSYIWSKYDWMKRLGITGSLGEQPIIYQVLNPELDAKGNASIVFVEVEMKDGLGFYSGQVSQYAIVKDSEVHKEIYITEAWFKVLRDDAYKTVEAEGILIDLADAASMRVEQQTALELNDESVA